MRTLILSTALAATIVLAGGGVAAGQSASMPEAMQAGGATIGIGDVQLVVPAVLVPDADRSVYHADGQTMTMAWTSSDARLSGQATCLGNKHMNRDGSGVESEVFQLVNEDGSWAGTSTGLVAVPARSDLVIGIGPQPTDRGHHDLVLLEGAGSYEGLSALVEIDWTQDPPVATATVLRGDLPATPAMAMIR